MFEGFHFETFLNFVAAILIGALVGIERERRKHEDKDPAIGGVRTFMLAALIGALGGWLAQELDSAWVLVAALFSIVAPVVAS